MSIHDCFPTRNNTTFTNQHQQKKKNIINRMNTFKYIESIACENLVDTLEAAQMMVVRVVIMPSNMP